MGLNSPLSPKIDVIGAGVIGLSCAWVLAKRGASVRLFDNGQMGRTASWAAAGMIAPAYEAFFEADDRAGLFSAFQRSAALWPEWAKALGAEPLLILGPSLVWDWTPQAISALKAAGPDPALGDDGALALAGDFALCPRPMLQALRNAAQGAGVTFHAEAPSSAQSGFDRPTIVAPGAFGARRLVALAPELAMIGPVKGQMLRLEGVGALPGRVLRGRGWYSVSHGPPGEAVIGATEEPGEYNDLVDAAALDALRAAAAIRAPGLSAGRMVENWSGVRPATSDFMPLIGASAARHAIIACGHYRHGWLLAPLTANMLADFLLEGRFDPLLALFDPLRPNLRKANWPEG